MPSTDFWREMSEVIEHYNLLRHPFYEAWDQGSLTLNDLREFAIEYYHHLASFPAYLREFAARLPLANLRQIVLARLWEELGMQEQPARANNLLWLDFAIGTGALPHDVFTRKPISEVVALIEFFLGLARSGSREEVLAALYVYDIQVARIAQQKAETLRTKYALDATACRYFTVHTTADIAHATVWREQLQEILRHQPEAADRTLSAATRTARALWKALDGIDLKRVASKPNR